MASEDLLKKAVAAFNALSPEQQAEMLEEQRQSWVRGNVGLSRDERDMTSPMMPRPAPVATDTGLVTVGGEYLDGHTWKPMPAGVTDFALRGFKTRALCDRSQAEKLLAAKDDECKYLKSTLSAWFDTKKITEDSLKPLMVAAVKGYLRTCSSGGMPQELIDEVLPAVECMIDYGVFAESVTQYTMSLKADNAALTARVKELEKDFYDADKSDISARDLLNDQDEKIEALEDKLSAAEKALTEADEALQADAIASAHAAIQAALGGKPS